MIPTLDSRISALEKINQSNDFSNLLTLVEQKLHKNFEECAKRLTNIENIEKEFDKTALKQKMLKLEESVAALKKEMSLHPKTKAEEVKKEEVAA